MRSTVITHFYNEAYLLPWWLEHHTRLFAEGILFDRGSTDGSREICERLAPHWQVRTVGRELAVEANELQIMSAEFEVQGWKIILSTTEFFCCRTMEDYLVSLEDDGTFMYRVPGFAVLDHPTEETAEPLPSVPLVEQRHYGYYDPIHHSRFIHRCTHGRYHPGRHHSSTAYAGAPPGAVIKWFSYSPWTEGMIQRKLQIQHTLAPGDRVLGFGAHHFVDREELQAQYARELTRARHLRSYARYRDVFPRTDEDVPRPAASQDATTIASC